jgi:hypothetical protein
MDGEFVTVALRTGGWAGEGNAFEIFEESVRQQLLAWWALG